VRAAEMVRRPEQSMREVGGRQDPAPHDSEGF
jgi:hypothetical protein